jgi:aldehyde dehydrogenase (NAD+)
MQENVISKIYIDGEFATPHGTELADLFNPATGQVIGQVQLVGEVDTAAFFVCNELATAMAAG